MNTDISDTMTALLILCAIILMWIFADVIIDWVARMMVETFFSVVIGGL